MAAMTCRNERQMRVTGRGSIRILPGVVGLLWLLAGTWSGLPAQPSLPAASSGSAGSSGPASSSGPAPKGRITGFCLQLPSSDDGGFYDQCIDEIAQAGANFVLLSVAAYQENATSLDLAIRPGGLPDDARLLALIQHAHQRHLGVALMPIVLLKSPRLTEWRGKIDPTSAPGGGRSWDEWWKLYQDYILHYARLAKQGGVEMFAVGSELISTESQKDRWHALIAQVRAACDCRLTYAANWDHYMKVSFWDDLDYLSMSSYYDLTEGKSEFDAQTLQAAWRKYQKDILAFQAKINKPLLFTELGWPNQPTAAKDPWNYYASTRTDPQLQKTLFEAFFAVWSDQPALAGFFIWEWRNGPQSLDPATDNSYVPMNKPALEVIRRYLAGPATGPATHPAAN